LGYNIKLENGQIVRPAVMVSKEDIDIPKGTSGSDRYTSITGIASKKELYEVSLNWLVNRDKLKLNISYDWGKVKEKDFSYVGMGLQLIY